MKRGPFVGLAVRRLELDTCSSRKRSRGISVQLADWQFVVEKDKNHKILPSKRNFFDTSLFVRNTRGLLLTPHRFDVLVSMKPSDFALSPSFLSLRDCLFVQLIVRWPFHVLLSYCRQTDPGCILRIAVALCLQFFEVSSSGTCIRYSHALFCCVPPSAIVLYYVQYSTQPRRQRGRKARR